MDRTAPNCPWILTCFSESTPGLQIKSGHLTMPANPNNQTLPPFRQRDWRAGPGG